MCAVRLDSQSLHHGEALHPDPLETATVSIYAADVRGVLMTSRYKGDADGTYLTDTWRFSVATKKWTKVAAAGVQPPARTWVSTAATTAAWSPRTFAVAYSNTTQLRCAL